MALEWIVIDSEPWRAAKREVAKNDQQLFLRKQGSSIIYKQTQRGYECTGCQSEIMSATVVHPIHDGPFPLSGSGQCEYEEVPYCQKCEKRPEYNGVPITQRNEQ